MEAHLVFLHLLRIGVISVATNEFFVTSFWNVGVFPGAVGRREPRGCGLEWEVAVATVLASVRLETSALDHGVAEWFFGV